MNDWQIRATLTNMVTNLGADAEYELRHDDFVAEMPQSGKRFRGPVKASAGARGPESNLRRRSWPIAQAAVR